MTYTREFKIDAIELIKKNELSLNKASKMLRVTLPVLAGWKKEYEADPDHAFEDTKVTRAENAEIKHLRREVSRLMAERDIFFRVATYFNGQGSQV